MKKKEDSKSQLKKELLLGFHKQFAENQRVREQSFLKIFGFLGSVIIGYSYVYHKTTEFDYIELSFIAIISQILLVFGALIVLSIAYNFRRDQTINAKIRTYARIIGDNNIFPSSYDPRKSNSLQHWHKWLPSFLSNFFIIFPIVLVTLQISYIIKLNLFFTFCAIDWFITSTIIVGILSFLTIAYSYFSYYYKLKKFISINSSS